MVKWWVMRQWASRSGFTIVELLIVIVVIAILAAITVVAYTGIQGRAYDSTVQSDMRQSFIKVQQFYAEQGRLPDNMNEYNQLFAAIRSAYGNTDAGLSNFYLYCRADNGVFAIIGRSKTDNAFAQSTEVGWKQVTWSDASATTCSRAGVPSSTPGYQVAWIGSGGAWNSFFTPGS